VTVLPVLRQIKDDFFSQPPGRPPALISLWQFWGNSHFQLHPYVGRFYRSAKWRFPARSSIFL